MKEPTFEEKPLSPEEKERISALYQEIGNKVRALAEKKTTEITKTEVDEIIGLFNSVSQEKWTTVCGEEKSGRMFTAVSRLSTFEDVFNKDGTLPEQFEIPMELVKEMAEKWES